MEGYRTSTYGDGFADVYDEWYTDLPDPESCARHVAPLARGGHVLELGVGTGRLASALVRRGVSVVGIDASAAMLDRLTARAPGADETDARTPGAAATVHALRGDMAILPLRSTSVAVALAAFNTLFNLTSEGSQLDCLREVARVLERGGSLVVEAIVAPVTPETIEDVAIKTLELDQVVLTVSRLDPTGQTITGQHIQFTESGTRLRPWVLRYLTTDQLDALAASVGLHLDTRWADWDGTPFGDDARSHVSTYRKA